MEKIDVKQLQTKLERLKRAYKKEKEKLEWIENDFEESLIMQAMERYRREIREIRQTIDESTGKGEEG